MVLSMLALPLRHVPFQADRDRYPIADYLFVGTGGHLLGRDGVDQGQSLLDRAMNDPPYPAAGLGRNYRDLAAYRPLC